MHEREGKGEVKKEEGMEGREGKRKGKGEKVKMVKRKRGLHEREGKEGVAK